LPQVGFGWSNGVALALLDRFGDTLVSRDNATAAP
jgi:neutral trehalase